MGLREQLANRGLSYEQAAETLNERGVTIKAADGERPITAADVSRRGSRPAYRSWREALELDEEPKFIQSSSSEATVGADSGDGRPTAAGIASLGVPAVVELPFDGLEARKRIELVYVGIGKGVGTAMRNPAIEIVFAQHAPKIAERWIAAAKQNARVAQIVTYVTAGGAVGDLIIAHLMLTVSLLIVSGRLPIGGIGGVLGPDVIVPTAANGQKNAPAADRPGGVGPVRAVADDASASAE